MAISLSLLQKRNREDKTPLELAKELEDFELVSLLVSYERNLQLIEQKKLAVNLHHAQSRWLSNLTVFYGQKKTYGFNAERKHKCLEIKDDIHQELRKKGLQLQTEIKEKSSPNFVFANLGFIYRTPEHSDDSYYHFHTFTIQKRNTPYLHITTEYPTQEAREQEFIEDLKRYHPDNLQRIEGIVKNSPAFFQTFHHSERALFKHLEHPDNLRSYAEEFANTLMKGKGFPAQTVKVYAVILDIHSTRYLCNWCEPALHYFQQSQAPFITRLQAQLEQLGFIISSRGLYVTTRYSAEGPDNDKPVKPKQQHEDPTVTINIKDQRAQNTNLILQRDNQQIIGDVEASTVCTSRAPDRLPDRQGSNKKMKLR